MKRLYVFLLMAAICITGCQGNQEKGKTAVNAKNGYVGSEKCGECHDQIFATWQQTLHARAIQDAKKNPKIIDGDFSIESEFKIFKTEDIILTHGIQWKQRYIDKDWHILPAQWVYQTETWADYHFDEWKKVDWREACAKCHVVGYDEKTKDWVELSVGCEACHGPGEEHVNADAAKKVGTIVNPKKLPSDRQAEICGQCHTRGKTPDEKYEYPIGYMPGEDLIPADFKPVSKDDTKAWWPDGSVKQHRQQYIEWKDSRHQIAGVTCVTCHDTHKQTTKFGTKLSPNNLCLGCHSSVSTDSKTGHAPLSLAPQHGDCIGCHMAPTGKSGDFGDERSHSFRVLKPRATLEQGAGDVAKQPNACNLCHWHAGDDPAALQQSLDTGVH